MDINIQPHELQEPALAVKTRIKWQALPPQPNCKGHGNTGTQKLVFRKPEHRWLKKTLTHCFPNAFGRACFKNLAQGSRLSSLCLLLEPTIIISCESVAIKKVDFEIYGFLKGTESRDCAGVPGPCCLSGFLPCPVQSETQEQKSHRNLTAWPALLSCIWSCPFLQVFLTQSQPRQVFL